MSDLLSSQIYLSRDRIRALISNEIKSYLELENVDLTKSSFLTYIIDIISTLTGNLMFYQLSTYREFFLTKAQLPESILNLSAFLGYNTKEAKYATVNLLMTIPFGFEDSLVQFQIPYGFKFKTSDGIEFRTDYITQVVVTNNSMARVTVFDENKRYNLPVDITSESFSFVLQARQYKLIQQEFQVDEDLQIYQFYNLDVPISGKVSEMIVRVTPPGSSSSDVWTEFSSTFLMSNTDKGYVSRRTDTGRRLSFGNDLIGVQPKPGSKIEVITKVTEGADGNVIAGSIREGDRIYVTTMAGNREIVEYNVINVSPATGGADEESFEDIRKNAINSLTALNRLVSENDYKLLNTVVPGINLAQNSLPVLKRSDLKINEISLFTTLLFGTNSEEVYNLVPMRNAILQVPTGQNTIYRDTVVTIDGEQFLTLFNIDIDYLNNIGYYSYIIHEIETIPSLETSYTSTYNIYADKLTVKRQGNDGIFILHYKSEEPNFNQTYCEIMNELTGVSKLMTNDATSMTFVYTYSPYTNIALGEQPFVFTIYDPNGNPVSKYEIKITFRNDLKTFMISNTVDSDGITTIYDVPVIKKSYYDSINKKQFELEIMQTLITSINLTKQRMLTDFTNIKFTNTCGLLRNIKYNPTTKINVKSFVSNPPQTAQIDDRYILVNPSPNATQYQNNILRCVYSDSTSATYTYEVPVIDTIIYVESEGKKYIYSESGWVTIPEYKIPIEIEIEVFRGLDFSGTLSSMAELVRDTIFNAFKNRFGTNIALYRSEIIDVVQEIPGVKYCRLRKPETSIFFDFDIDKLTQQELLEYGPEYVYFTKENITVKVL